MPNLDLEKKTDYSSFRKIAIGTWSTTYDPSVYGTLRLRMDLAAQYIEEYRKKTGKRLTVSHMMAKATAALLAEIPDANAILRFNRIYRRKNIGIFFQVAMTDQGSDKIDLSGATIHDADKKSITEIVDEFQEKVQRVRDRKDPELERTRDTFLKIPFLLLNFVLKLISLVSFALNLDLRWAGLPKDPFGSAMVTNVGSLGLDTAYVPLVPYSRVPLLLATGEIKEVPLVEDGEVVVGKVMDVNATFDHRVIDGFHAAVAAKVLRKWMQDPYENFGPIPDGTDAEKDGEESGEA